MVRFVFDGGVLFYKYHKKRRFYLFLKGKGHFDMPKGHIEKNETTIEAAKREALEETGISAELDRYFKHVIVFWYVEKGEKVKTQLTMFLAKAHENTKVKVTEHTGYSWLSYNQVMNSSIFENEKELVRIADDYIKKKEELDSINKEYKKIPEHQTNWALSKNFVPGDGPANAKIMLIGQAPGINEDIQMRPFVGASGKMLDHMLKLAGLKRDNIYITSVVQFFPPHNRMPKENEVFICASMLFEQIIVIDPSIIVLLGALASKVVIGVSNVMKRHGELIRGKYFVTIHPAAAVRLKKNIPIMEQDFRKLKTILKNSGLV